MGQAKEMTESNLKRAKLVKIVDKVRTSFEVQFNPETLKVSYANQIEKPKADKNAPAPTTQFVGKGTTKLTVQLWFDVTGELRDADRGVKDVRVLTGRVVDLMKATRRANAPANSSEAELFIPPQVEFQWGTFSFEGIAESIEESLEFWSPDGRPMRASIFISLSQQELAFKAPEGGAQAAPSAGTRQLTPAPAGSTLQGMAEARGMGDQWQSVAAANGIENPRNLTPGLLVDFGKAG